MIDSLILKQLVLAPILYAESPNVISELQEKISALDKDIFCDLIIKNGLAALWYDFLVNETLLNLFNPDQLTRIKNEKIKITAVLLNQTRVLTEIHTLFESANIPYVVIKGGCLRHTIYTDPIHRPCSDLDILIHDENKIQAIKVLARAEFNLILNEKNLSHETTLVKQSVPIDLHWKLLRPGRTRNELANQLLKNRVRVEYFWGTSHQDALMVMLIHPAYTKYLNSPHSLLLHLIDELYLIKQNNINRDQLYHLLDSYGSKTVAWLSLYWLNKVTGLAIPENFYLKLEPGYIRKRYLAYWVENNLVEKLIKQPVLIQIAFTLVLHDKFMDSIKFVNSIIKEKRLMQENVREIMEAYESCA